MERVDFDTAETYEPEEGWRRVEMAGSENFSFEWFEKPAGHASPMHNHENEQVCVVTEGELTIHFEDSESVTIRDYDSVYLEPDELHSVENTGSTPARGVDVFAPGRSFDFWTDRP
jgi:quercetin dioxygenase-like cupin family protein